MQSLKGKSQAEQREQRIVSILRSINISGDLLSQSTYYALHVANCLQRNLQICAALGLLLTYRLRKEMVSMQNIAEMFRIPVGTIKRGFQTYKKRNQTDVKIMDLKLEDSPLENYLNLLKAEDQVKDISRTQFALFSFAPSHKAAAAAITVGYARMGSSIPWKQLCKLSGCSKNAINQLAFQKAPKVQAEQKFSPTELAERRVLAILRGEEPEIQGFPQLSLLDLEKDFILQHMEDSRVNYLQPLINHKNGEKSSKKVETDYNQNTG